MKLKHMLLYLIIGLGGLALGIQGVRTLLKSVSFETSLGGVTLIAWGLAIISHALLYWHFSRHYVATATEPRPTLELFNARLNPTQKRILNAIRYSFTGLAVVWLLTKWFSKIEMWLLRLIYCIEIPKPTYSFTDPIWSER